MFNSLAFIYSHSYLRTERKRLDDIEISSTRTLPPSPSSALTNNNIYIKQVKLSFYSRKSVYKYALRFKLLTEEKIEAGCLSQLAEQ